MNFLRWLKKGREEKKWGLYNEKPKLYIDWLFSFIDRFAVGGHCSNTIVYNYQKTMSSNVIVINLNKRTNEDVIMSSMNHEAIHVAIFNCLKYQFNFIEKVIDDWLTNEHLECNGWNSNTKVIKRK